MDCGDDYLGYRVDRAQGKQDPANPIRHLPAMTPALDAGYSTDTRTPMFEGISFTGNLCGGRSAGQSGEPSGRLMVHHRDILVITLNCRQNERDGLSWHLFVDCLGGQ